MSTLSTAELEAQIETDLSDSALQQIIDSVEADMDRYAGPASGHVAEFEPRQQTVIMLPSAAATITTVVEFTGAVSEPTETTLAADDYELSSDGWELRRLSDGTNSDDVWGWRVVVTFDHESDTARRKQVAVALARLEITHSGFTSVRDGDHSEAAVDYDKERMRILRRLKRARVA